MIRILHRPLSFGRNTYSNDVQLLKRCLSISASTYKDSTLLEKPEAARMDFEAARPFKRKSFKELVRAWTVLKVSSYNIIVNNAERVSVSTFFFLLDTWL